MEPSRPQNDSFTPSQRQAVNARGNVLVMAGAGTGKTKTLVARCLDCLERERVSLDELLIVTFTEAAAAEMRQRLRRELEKKSAAAPGDDHWPRQLALFDIAHIGTLHSFCLKLVREHFYELGLDPQFAILDQGEARQRATETLDEQFQSHYEGDNEFSLAVQNLIQTHGGGRDEKIRALVLRLHHYSQTRPDAAGWLTEQIGKFSIIEPVDWQQWLLAAIEDWHDEWLPVLEDLKSVNEKAAELAGILAHLKNDAVSSLRPDRVGAQPRPCTREFAADVLEQIVSADGNWPAKRKTVLREPLEHLFAEAAFLASLATVKESGDPLSEDWNWVRGHMETLVRLAQEFARQFAARKLADGVLDFHDLEQFALKLLWDFSAGKPTDIAEIWRKKLHFVFVDEYQDINAAQDKIIAALSRDNGEANRFLVGDVKQSIYRFRLADPKIFRDYARDWSGPNGRVIPLSENFRSREPLLNFVNSIFSLLMRENPGGVEYDEDAKLKFGSSETRADFSAAKDSSPRAEVLLRLKTAAGDEAQNEPGLDELMDLGETEKEARLLAIRLKQLQTERHQIWDDEEKQFRAVEWRDMAVLLRTMSGKSEVYAMEFERVGVPLVIARGGFYESSEISDLLSLLQLLDNPLQDVPCIAVLRSPLVGLSLDELAAIRLAVSHEHFWTALVRSQKPEAGIQNPAAAKVPALLERFSRWRKLARQVSLSRCLEQVLAETHYAGWLRTCLRGEQRHANVRHFLNLAQQFDQFQRQGLYRFLKFIEAQREAGAEPDVPAATDQNAVRLMSIHQSKGLEFPVVALADLVKRFNTQDQHGEIIFDEQFGLCPRVKPPQTERRYSSLPHWLARRHQHREQAGEELRLLYVAMTRARDTLILTASLTEKKWTELWQENSGVPPQKILSAKSYADWLGLWFAQQPGVNSEKQGELPFLRWRIVDDAELTEAKREDGKQEAEVRLPEVDDKVLQNLREKLTWQYGFGAATEQAAKSSVTVLRRQAADELDDEAEQVFPAKRNFNAKLSAAGTGTAHHKFLQYVALENIGGLVALEAEAERLESEKVLSADERKVLDLPAIAAFWDSDEGKGIQREAANVRRELPFTAKFSPLELSEIIGTRLPPDLKDEFIVVQGVADLVVLLPEEIWLIDFKTDNVGAENLPAKIKDYAPQLRLYAGALSKIYLRPVARCWLHFLSAQKTVDIKLTGCS
ncbi:MAG: helicase-exonuclease AddAB subunit AddA [Limisphaerales bacterium]